MNRPFTVGPFVVVSKDHRLTSAYRSPWADREWGIHPDALAAFTTMATDARAEGLTLKVRSGYRSYAEQAASFNRAMQTYDEATARKYFAEPGASEHQTGLALDAWDGVNRGYAFTATREAAWLGEHAHEYGFILRYPEGKSAITGYAYESWHLRWIGAEYAQYFTPESALTLEEFLGLA
ncbi:MAG: M15 family metallopeptidase [Propioniciclava sp.]